MPASAISATTAVRRSKDPHYDVTLFTGFVDSHLNENKYIVPGLGDACDRIVGTKSAGGKRCL